MDTQLKIVKRVGGPVIFECPIWQKDADIEFKPWTESTKKACIGADQWTTAQFLRLRKKSMNQFLLGLKEEYFKMLARFVTHEFRFSQDHAGYKQFDNLITAIARERYLGID